MCCAMQFQDVLGIGLVMEPIDILMTQQTVRSLSSYGSLIPNEKRLLRARALNAQ